MAFSEFKKGPNWKPIVKSSPAIGRLEASFVATLGMMEMMLKRSELPITDSFEADLGCLLKGIIDMGGSDMPEIEKEVNRLGELYGL